MFTRGASQAEVARRLCVTREAVRQWVEAWRTGGPAALAARPRVRPRRVALARIAVALNRARTHRAAAGVLTTLDVRQIIERAFVVRYCASSARAILHRLGFAYTRKTGWQRIGAGQRAQTRLEARRRAS